MKFFYIEITDLFCGEPNYSYATRHVLKAKSKRGAVNRLSRLTGLNWRYDGIKYVSKRKLTCAFIEEYDNDYPEQYDLVFIMTDDRNPK